MREPLVPIFGPVWSDSPLTLDSGASKFMRERADRPEPDIALENIDYGPSLIGIDDELAVFDVASRVARDMSQAVIHGDTVYADRSHDVRSSSLPPVSDIAKRDYDLSHVLILTLFEVEVAPNP